MRASPLCSLPLAAAIAFAPCGASADTAFLRSVPYSPSWFPTLNVRTGGSLDVELEAGDVLASAAIVADPRWSVYSVTAGPKATPHLVVKPRADLPDAQLVTIPTSGHVYHLLLTSGQEPSTAYTVVFYDPRPQVAQGAAPAPTARPSYTYALRYSCATMNPRAYSVHGDRRVPVEAVCDDGVRTYVFVGASKVAAVPYRVDPGGHQDQLVNPLFGALPPGSPGGAVGEWVLDGVFDHLALLADSSRGQIRVNVDRVTP
jgi:type IV secretory pathway VirB9-like protein